MRLYALLLLQCCASSSLAAQAPTALAALRPPSRLRRRLKDRERVRLGVEHVPVERHERVLAEQEVQVLERLGEPERLHAVLVHDGDAVDVLDAGEPARGELAVRREGEEDAPALRAGKRAGEGRGGVSAGSSEAGVLGGRDGEGGVGGVKRKRVDVTTWTQEESRGREEGERARGRGRRTQSRYTGSPVTLYATNRLSTVSGRRMLRASIGGWLMPAWPGLRELMNQSRFVWSALSGERWKLTICEAVANRAGSAGEHWRVEMESDGAKEPEAPRGARRGRVEREGPSGTATHLGGESGLAARVRVDASADEGLAGEPIVALRLGEAGLVGRHLEPVAVGRAEEERRAEEAREVVLL